MTEHNEPKPLRTPEAGAQLHHACAEVKRQVERVPPGTWVGFGDRRRYLLAEDSRGIVWPWFQTAEGGWDHTLDPADLTLWQIKGEADEDDVASLARHVENIDTHGCGARGYCRVHRRA